MRRTTTKNCTINSINRHAGISVFTLKTALTSIQDLLFLWACLNVEIESVHRICLIYGCHRICSWTYTNTRFFFSFHKLPKRYMNAQQLVQCMVPRALFRRPEYIKVGCCTRRTRNCCCPVPALAARIFYFIATMSFAGYFLVRSLLSAFPAYLRFPV